MACCGKEGASFLQKGCELSAKRVRAFSFGQKKGTERCPVPSEIKECWMTNKKVYYYI